jgi:hypothetical protein
MRAVAAVMILLVGGLVQPAVPVRDATAETPAPLPDLQALGIDFSFLGEPLQLVEAKPSHMFPLTVTVYIINAGPGNSTGANLSVFQDGRLLAIVPVGTALNTTGQENQAWAIYMWNISGIQPGRHVIRAEVMDPVGDMNISDNSIEGSLYFLDRSPDFNLSLTSDTLWANVTSDMRATVEFSGEVRTEVTEGIEPSVTVDASTDIGWDARVFYGPGFSGNSTVKPFKVAVTVPAGTSSEVSGQVVVTCFLDVGGLVRTDQIYARVNVSSYFCASVECERPHQTIGPGDHETFEYLVYNKGNTIDTYSVKIANREELERKGWTLNLSLAIGRVFPGGFGRFNVRATPPKDWSLYKDETTVIMLNVSSGNNTSNPVFYSEELPATVRVRGYNTPGVDLLSTSIIILAAACVGVFLVRRRRRQ